MKKYGPKAPVEQDQLDNVSKMKALEKELKRVTEERDILKKAAVYFASQSGCVYGNRKLHSDLHDIGEKCGLNRVHKLMKQEGIKAQVGYRKPRHRSGKADIFSVRSSVGQ